MNLSVPSWVAVSTVLFALGLAGCPDAGAGDSGVDAGPGADVGAPLDAGPVPDAGESRDGGAIVDAGEPFDGGDSVDAGGPLDAGDPLDGGAIVDAGDAGELEDGGLPPGETRVFVTSSKTDGAVGGLLGADARCSALATTAGLGGTWLAWLGDGVDGPATRFAQAQGAYRLVGGDIVADNWADLIDGTLAVPINHDEFGTPLPQDDDMIVWTAVFHTGGNPTPVNCAGWTSATEPLVPTGLASATDTGWTVTAPYSCGEMHRLYCFEQ